MLNTKTTIIFDFDGTLADTLPIFLQIAREFASEFGVDSQSIDVQTIRNKSIRQMLKHFKIPITKLPLILLRGRSLVSKRMNKAQPFPQIKEMLAKLKNKGYKLGILSSNSLENIKVFLQVNDLEYFDFIHSEKNIFGKGKILQHMLNSYKLKHEEVLYVGDEVRDIEACKGVGIAIVAVTWGLNTGDFLETFSPNYIVDSPEELNKLLKSKKI